MPKDDISIENEKNTYEIVYKEDGVFLIVRRLPGKERIDEAEVFETVRRKRIKKFNASMISEAVKRASGKPVKIAEPQEIEKVDSEIYVSLSPDKMKAFVNIKPPEGGGEAPTLERILYSLKEMGVVYGLKADVIKSLAQSPIYFQNVCVAEGDYPVNGENGKIKYLVEIKKDRKPVILEDGSVNYRDLNLIENVHAGQKLCEIIPPTKGKPGKNILGKELKALDGKPAKLVKGRNVSDDGQSIFADIDGQVVYHDGKISVFATYEVPADVDNSTGNIKFVGNVSIRGSVLSGFTVEAGGNVEVFGVVEGAFIKAEGDIILKRGMHGGGKGKIISGGDIVAKYIESSIVEAKNDIRAEAIMHSDVKCGNKIELGGRKGLLVGGIARAGNEIEAKVIGSHLATVTVVEVGVDPYLRERYKFLRTEIIKLEENIKKTTQALTILRKIEKAGMLTKEKKDLLCKSIRSKEYFENKRQEYKNEFNEVEKKLKEVTNGKIRVQNTVYPGTRVSIGTASMYVKETLHRCVLYKDRADIRIGTL